MPFWKDMDIPGRETADTGQNRRRGVTKKQEAERQNANNRTRTRVDKLKTYDKMKK